jgi:hypothetical protein
MMMYRFSKILVTSLFVLTVSLQLHAEEIKIKMGRKKFRLDSTLLSAHSDSVLAKMFNGNMAKPPQNSKGYFLVDGDPEYFKHILSYWRYQDADIARGNVDLDLLSKQAEYWGAYDFCCYIEGLKKGLGKQEASATCNITFRMIVARNETSFNRSMENLEKNFDMIDLSGPTVASSGSLVYLARVIPKNHKKTSK